MVQVSSALDFTPHESVYKNLINLAVEDHEISDSLVRSKYPQPRNKDIIPKLSNFRNSKYTEQYFEITNPIAQNPITVNSLNAFTISNKVCMWKTCKNNFLY